MTSSLVGVDEGWRRFDVVGAAEFAAVDSEQLSKETSSKNGTGGGGRVGGSNG